MRDLLAKSLRWVADKIDGKSSLVCDIDRRRESDTPVEGWEEMTEYTWDNPEGIIVARQVWSEPFASA